jgi:hypothetical protein
VVILQLLPMTIDVLSYGNLSNAFAQGLTLLFFAWWAGDARGSWVLGALLLALAATAHLSAFVVLAVLCPWLAWAHWPGLARDRTRWIAMVVGMGVAAAYFGSFTGLVVSQLGRLGEGGGQAGQGLAASLLRQGASVLEQWGVPALVLVILGLPIRLRDRLDRDLAAWWGGGGLLLLVAVATPLDVRWVYALGAAAATAAAAGTAWLWRRGRAGRIVALALLAAQAALAVWSASVAVWERYR